jgi:hypothetical protein
MTGETTNELSMTSAMSLLRPKKPQRLNGWWAKPRGLYLRQHHCCVLPEISKMCK